MAFPIALLGALIVGSASGWWLEYVLGAGETEGMSTAQTKIVATTHPVLPVGHDDSGGYPTRDGRPMGETDVHRGVMMDTIAALTRYYAGQQVYVSGNLLVFYEPGNKRKHISPDVFVTKGLEMKLRPNYRAWELPAPQVVIEVTSPSTRNEDLKKKLEIYRDVIKVQEYFLFDPKDEYLDPPLMGYRLEAGQYVPLEPVAGRLPSGELNLHLERDDQQLRLYNPATNRWLPTMEELGEEVDALREDKDALQAALRQSLEEAARLRAELERARQPE